MFNSNQAFLSMQKLKSAPRSVHQESRLKQKKIFSICFKQLLIRNAELYSFVLTPSLKKKGYHEIWEANVQPLGANVPAFINIMMSMCLAFISNQAAKQQAENAQSQPQVLLALTLGAQYMYGKLVYRMVKLQKQAPSFVPIAPSFVPITSHKDYGHRQSNGTIHSIYMYRLQNMCTSKV